MFLPEFLADMMWITKDVIFFMKDKINDILFCKIYEIDVATGKQFYVQLYTNTLKHKSSVAIYSVSLRWQKLLF